MSEIVAKLEDLIKSYSPLTYHRKYDDKESKLWAQTVVHLMSKHQLSFTYEELEEQFIDMQDSKDNTLQPVNFVLKLICGINFDMLYTKTLNALAKSYSNKVIFKDDFLILEALRRSGFQRKFFFESNTYPINKYDEVKKAYLSLDTTKRYNNVEESFYSVYDGMLIEAYVRSDKPIEYKREEILNVAVA